MTEVTKFGPLMGVTELAGLLGVTRQRADALTARADFPAPRDTLAQGRVWETAAVLPWAEMWQRQRATRPRGGRPRKVPPPA